MLGTELTVYIVDDENSIVEWLVSNVEWDIYNCKVIGYSTDAVEAYEFLEKHPVDLLLTDICMPIMSGLDLIREVKGIYPDIFIIVISAYDKFEYVKQAFRYGIINYCMKPIDPDELHDSLKSIEVGLQERKFNYWKQDITVFRNSIFHQLINGEVNELLFDEQYELAGIQWNVPCCQMALLNTCYLEESQYLNIFGKLNEINQKGLYIFLDRYLNIVLLFLNESGIDEKIRQKVYQILQEEALVEKVKLFVGGKRNHYRQIAESYGICLDFSRAAILFCSYEVWTEAFGYKQFYQKYQARIANIEISQLKIGLYDQVMEIAREIRQENHPEEIAEKQMVNLAVLLIRNILAEYPTCVISGEPKLEKYIGTDIFIWLKDFLKQFADKRIESKEQLHPSVKYAVGEVAVNYKDTLLSLQEIAKECNISSAYLGKLFKEQIGEYFNDYLLRIRLKEAEHLLKDSTKRIREIATEVGFYNTSYFNKVFLKKYGISPSEYRKKGRS